MPTNQVRYFIAKDDPLNFIDTLSGSTYAYTDPFVGPDEKHTYYVYTYTSGWGGHRSLAATVSGRTRPRTARASSGIPKQVVVSWDDISAVTDEAIIRRNNEQIATIAINSASDTSYTDSDPSLIPGFIYDYAVTWIKKSVEYRLETSGATQPNGRIRGTVATPLTQLPVADVAVCAVLENEIPQDTAGTTYCDTTDALGQFDIRRIYYHREASFKISASKENHGFDPASFTSQLLELDFPNLTVNFKDTTSFLVSGTVAQIFQGDTCGIPGAEIWLDGIYQDVKTAADGSYRILVEESGTYTVEARLGNHQMIPEVTTLLVDRETIGVNFIDTTRQQLDGRVKGSCDLFIGLANLRIYSLDNGPCIDTVIQTDAWGYYDLYLPARRYAVEVVDFEPEQGLDLSTGAVLSYFETEQADLTFEKKTLDFTYRRAPEIIVRGLPQPTCSGLATSIVEQNESYFLDIEVRETFGEASCPVETGFVVVYDEAADKANTPDTLYLEEGKATYELIPGQPNLIAPHYKRFQLVAEVEKEQTNWAADLIVTGIRPREQTFTTVMPEIPFLILHDPPGDASFSYFSQGSTRELGMRLFARAEGSTTISSEVKLGTRFEANINPIIALKTENWGTIGASMSVGSRFNGNTQWIVTTEQREAFQTSNNPDIIGNEGDVFVGAAMNLIYALADILYYNPNTCQIVSDVDLVMGNDGFATTFSYTEGHIRATLIPQLKGLRDIYSTTNPDSAAIYENQVSVWEQVLLNNSLNKQRAELIENRSFSAGATFASSVTSSIQSSFSVELSAFLEQSVVIGAGYEVAGSGVQGSVATRLRVELGAGASGSTLETTTTGFELKDDDPGDFFSVNIRKDPVYGTPVFDLVSGRSSCPWEAGTQPREDLRLSADSYFQGNIPADGEAVFELNLSNISQSDEQRTYILNFLQTSNPEGAAVSIGGSPAVGPIPYTIGPGAQRKATVTIQRGPRAFLYQGLQFVLTSGCEDAQVADTISLTADFLATYPPLAVASPTDNWLINGNGATLPIQVRNYDRDRLAKLQLQLAAAGSQEWQTIEEWQPTDLADGAQGLLYIWDPAGLNDGPYQLRLRADYPEADIFSSVISGMIDRRPPQVFGLPQPADRVLEATDPIAVQFDEPLNCFDFSAQYVQFTSLTTGTRYPVEVGCSDRTILLRPLWDFNAHLGEEIEVNIIRVKDRFQNERNDMISWTFLISKEPGAGAADSDQDGIPDAEDNCNLTANPDQSDLDGDGIGDACDEDIDGDGVANQTDNCPYFANPGQEDTDQDGSGDVCAPEADGDQDGISNATDNCPYQANPDQADLDNDGSGDVCDPDQDGDGRPNWADNCPFNPNPDQADTNGNLVGDACETVVSTGEAPAVIGHFRLRPNPAFDRLWLDIELLQGDHWEVSLWSREGRLCHTTGRSYLPEGSHQIPVDVSALPAGLYFIRLINADQVITRKVIVGK